MENYKITKEQILAIEKVGGADVSLYLKETFPEVFKTELEVGKWYKMKGETHFLCNFNGNIGNNGNSNGFNLRGEWMDNSMCFHNSDTYVEATPEEVESALINEAKKRGYKGGIKLSPLESCSNAIDTEKEDVYSYIPKVSHYIGNRLQLNGTGIYQDGKWAQILPQKKTVVPMDKALKIIAQKMKVSPENIEIQY